MRHIRNNRKGTKSAAGKPNACFERLLAFDMFAQPVPSFNVRGEETSRTNIGAFCSIMIAVVVL